jgi:hypothetical protein
MAKERDGPSVEGRQHPHPQDILQPTETCNPKTQTQCAKKSLKKNSRPFNRPLFHSLHTHEHWVSEVP